MSLPALAGDAQRTKMPIMSTPTPSTSGQLLLENAYTLLIFAGLWAMLHRITDIVRAFGVRSLRGG